MQPSRANNHAKGGDQAAMNAFFDGQDDRGLSEPTLTVDVDGFEGPLDDKHQRSSEAGWRFEKLPWEQC